MVRKIVHDSDPRHDNMLVYSSENPLTSAKTSYSVSVTHANIVYNNYGYLLKNISMFENDCRVLAGLRQSCS